MGRDGVELSIVELGVVDPAAVVLMTWAASGGEGFGHLV